MTRSVTITQMIKKYFMHIPDHKSQASFVEYAGNGIIYMYLYNGVKVVYNYKDDIVQGVDVNGNYMKDIINKWNIKNEKDYRTAFAYLLRGRMDALEITGDELAKRCDISRTTVFRILNKQVTPNAYTVYILEKNLQNSQNDVWHFL